HLSWHVFTSTSTEIICLFTSNSLDTEDCTGDHISTCGLRNLTVHAQGTGSADKFDGSGIDGSLFAFEHCWFNGCTFDFSNATNKYIVINSPGVPDPSGG